MRCNIIYFIAYTCFLAGIKYIPDDIVKYIVIAICILGFLSIYQYAPVAHPNKPVSVLKKNKFRKQSIILEVLFASGAIILLLSLIHILTAMLTVSTAQAAEIPRESVPINATEEQVVIVENIIGCLSYTSK